MALYVAPHFIAEWRAARKFSPLSPSGWWVNRWPALGWAETLLKAIAWTYAPYVALVPPPPGGSPVFLSAPDGGAAAAAAAAAADGVAGAAAAASVPPSLRAAWSALAAAPAFTGDAAFALQTGVMLGAAALILAAIIDRLVYREVISALFVIPNSWAHVVVAASMVRGGRAGVDAGALRGFCWWMLAGDLIKLVFFAVHDFDIIAVAKYVLYMLVSLFAVAYGVVLALEYGVIDAAAAAAASRRIVTAVVGVAGRRGARGGGRASPQ